MTLDDLAAAARAKAAEIDAKITARNAEMATLVDAFNQEIATLTAQRDLHTAAADDLANLDATRKAVLDALSAPVMSEETTTATDAAETASDPSPEPAA